MYFLISFLRPSQNLLLFKLTSKKRHLLQVFTINNIHTETYHKTAKVVVLSPDFLQSWYSRWSDLWSWFLLCSNRGHLGPLTFRCSVEITHPQHLKPGPYGQKFLPKINAFSSFCPTWEKCSLLPVEISDGNNGKIFEKFRLRRCVLHLQTLAKLKNSWLWFRMKTSCRR